MPQYAILGKNVLLMILRGSDYVPYVCATECSINFTQELISVKTIGHGRYPKRRVRGLDWSVSISGLAMIVNPTDAQKVFDRLDPLEIIESVGIKLVFTDQHGSTKEFIGEVLSESIELSSGADDFCTFTDDMVGNGGYTIETVIMPGTTIGGITTEDGDQLITEDNNNLITG